MITVKFHKSLQKYTAGKDEVVLERDTYYHTCTNCLNLFPDLERITKKLGFNKLEDIAIISNGKVISKEEFLFIPKDNSVIYLVPIFYGSGIDPISLAVATAIVSATVTTAVSISQGYDPLTALFRGITTGIISGLTVLALGPLGLGLGPIAGSALGAVVSTLGSMLINAITGPPANRSSLAGPSTGADDGNRRENDIFESIVNTANEGTIISLNYGMVRLGGQFIISDIETITQQKGVTTPAISSSVAVETGTQPGTASETDETLPRFGGASDA